MIYNPLAPDPNSLSDDDLQEKITQLQKKYLTASRFSSQTLVLQIQQTITMYVDEQQKRSREMMSSSHTGKHHALGMILEAPDVILRESREGSREAELKKNRGKKKVPEKAMKPPPELQDSGAGHA